MMVAAVAAAAAGENREIAQVEKHLPLLADMVQAGKIVKLILVAHLSAGVYLMEINRGYGNVLFLDACRSAYNPTICWFIRVAMPRLYVDWSGLQPHMRS
ncbi:hypothetical protein AKJ16_DCAP09211 [Drosera capensis]